eukprot:m.131268 g.131268  ORF g.131268 m.131268 type:complete len:226 (+) comp14620_c1_seq1:719-1396(+)
MEKQKKKDLRKEMGEQQKKIEFLEEKCEILKSSTAKKTTEDVEDLRNQLQENEADAQRLAEEHQKVIKRHKLLEEKLLKAEREVKESKDKQEQAKKLEETKNKEIQTLQQKLQLKEKENNELSNVNSKLSDENTKLSLQNASKDRDIKQKDKALHFFNEKKREKDEADKECLLCGETMTEDIRAKLTCGHNTVCITCAPQLGKGKKEFECPSRMCEVGAMVSLIP